MVRESKDSEKQVSLAKNASIYGAIHSFLGLFALYLSFKCNRGFNFGAFVTACCCPHLYIIYILATRGISFCM